MSNLGNKDVFSKNLKYYIERSGKDRKELAEIWGFPYSTVTEWINGRKYPRIDRIEIMADYFGIKKSDLIEEKVEKEPQNEVPVALSAPQGYDNLTDEQKELIQSLIDKYNEKNIGNK